MQAWVARRREGGALLSHPTHIGAAPAPFELLVVEVTDQGKRRPTKIARLFPFGSRIAVAELVAPKLVWFRKWGFVLSGMEHTLAPSGRMGAVQSWLCKLHPPAYAVGFKARHTHKDGVEMTRSTLMDRYCSTWKGLLSVESVKDEALGRHSVIGRLDRPAGEASKWPPSRLLGVELEWMSEERFSLAGFDPRGPSGDRPARLLRHGWLCEFEVDEWVEDSRPLRNAGPQQ